MASSTSCGSRRSAAPAIILGLLMTDAVRLAIHATVVLGVAVLIGAEVQDRDPRGGGDRRPVRPVRRGMGRHLAERRAAHGKPETTAAAGIFVFPLYFASTAFVPEAALPDWLQTFNKINPLSYLIDAIRADAARLGDGEDHGRLRGRAGGRADPRCRPR